MLTGGVSRGYADEMSELDLTLFLRPATYRLWIERWQSPLPEGDNLIGSWAVDLYYASIARERKEAWSPLKIWDRSFARVLYDPRRAARRPPAEKGALQAGAMVPPRRRGRGGLVLGNGARLDPSHGCDRGPSLAQPFVRPLPRSPLPGPGRAHAVRQMDVPSVSKLAVPSSRIREGGPWMAVGARLHPLRH